MTDNEESRYTRGRRALNQLEHDDDRSVLDNVAEFCPDMARLVVEFGYGDVFARPGLSAADRQLVTIAALGALGNAPSQLRFHVGGALNVGCKPEGIVETFIHLTVYAGFPAALNAIGIARDVFAEKGVAVSPSEQRTSPRDRFDVGSVFLERVDGHGGTDVVDGLADIAPDLGRFIVEYSFGDVYSRSGLTLREREMVTVAACSALGTCVPQLGLHMQGFFNVGGTRDELVELLIQIAVYAGFPASLNALSQFRHVVLNIEH
ncbi:carboxymuconolactone decarboxylase family protein [Actinomyces ruminicola]|uniref:4-carboxymuconolactone decarboxylase n=1 Tax=Actinomyces ruminicola TaxID=332524 RepID=A0A1G9YUZ8_9ACTO|nr:carboxymuconolactone decarboxylase family protein [Actinomyces ruminicola]SDN12914.1 4-carboxymuconolactone decarboxylase [Actinomyces ruminicola]